MLMHQVILLLSTQGVIGKSKSDSTGKKVQSKLFYFPKNNNQEHKTHAVRALLKSYVDVVTLECFDVILSLLERTLCKSI